MRGDWNGEVPVGTGSRGAVIQTVRVDMGPESLRRPGATGVGGHRGSGVGDTGVGSTSDRGGVFL